MPKQSEIDELRAAVRASLQTAETEQYLKAPVDHRLPNEPIPLHADYSANSTDPLGHRYKKRLISENEYLDRRNIALFQVQCADMELSQGDTLVYIDFPAGRLAHPPVDCDGLPFRSQKVRVQSKKLLATGSARFAEMLQPTYQFRIMRRRKLVNKLPDGVKYVLDLTPPTEGDDMVFQMTELSLTPGVRKWWSSYARLNVPFFLVKGHDDVCPCKELAVPPSETSGDSVMHLPLTVSGLVHARNTGRKLQIEQVPEQFDIPDYCPIRHRNGIIRLLMIIEGNGVFLNSAPRVWTLVALAKIYDCVSVVQDMVLQWLLEGRNCQFLEVLPEEAIKIGVLFENALITRVAFKILVNELALELASDEKTKERVDFNHTTLLGRRKGDVGDEFNNLIQHAARALLDRATAQLDQVQSEMAFEEWDLPEWNQLLAIERALQMEKDTLIFDHSLRIVQQIKSTLAASRALDLKALAKKEFVLPLVNREHVDIDRAKYVEPPDFEEFECIYREMNLVQKLLTRYPYKQLEQQWTEWVNRFVGEGDKAISVTLLCASLDENLAPLLRDHTPSNLRTWDAAFGLEDAGTGLIRRYIHPFDLHRLGEQVQKHIRNVGHTYSDADQEYMAMMTKHTLFSLTKNETKYLPLWAGGLNDGTGGVFEERLPPAEMGPSGPGPAYHTGITIPSDASSLSGSFVDDMSAMHMAGSATAASVDVQDSVSTIYRPDHVITDDKSIASESFQSDFGDYHEARDTVKAPGQEKEEIPQSLDDFLQATDSGDESTSTVCGGDDDDFMTLDDDDAASEVEAMSDSATTDAEMVIV